MLKLLPAGLMVKNHTFERLQSALSCVGQAQVYECHLRFWPRKEILPIPARHAVAGRNYFKGVEPPVWQTRNYP